MLVSQGFYHIVNCSFSCNRRSLYFFGSNITFSGQTVFKDNMQERLDQITSELSDQQGGVITSFQSHLYFMGESTFKANLARDGGTIHATSSDIWMYGSVLITRNTAVNDGGGV